MPDVGFPVHVDSVLLELASQRGELKPDAAEALRVLLAEPNEGTSAARKPA